MAIGRKLKKAGSKLPPQLPAPKRPVRIGPDPIRKNLPLILSYVGPGHWSFVGAVCREWREVYRETPDVEMQKQGKRGPEEVVTVTSKMTLYSSFFAAPGLLQVVSKNGLKLKIGGSKLHQMAGIHCDLASLKMAAKLGMTWSDHVLRGAADAGRLDTLTWLNLDRKRKLPGHLCRHAARAGSIPILKWLKEVKYWEFTVGTCRAAAEVGHTHVIKWLVNEGGAPWDATVPLAATTVGDLPTLQWLLEHDAPNNLEDILTEAAKRGHIHILRYMMEQQGRVFTAATMASVMKCQDENARLATCHFLRGYNCPWDETVTNAAAENGRHHTLQWLHAAECPWEYNTLCIKAAQGGIIVMLEWLRTQGPIWSAILMTDMLNAAGAFSKLAAAQWLRQQGATWPAVLHYGGRKWSAERLAWAREQGCDAPCKLPRPVVAAADTNGNGNGNGNGHGGNANGHANGNNNNNAN
jgi:hypothetical protein